MKVLYKNRLRGFTLVELMVVMTISSFIMAGILSTFLLFTRSSLRIANYVEMEGQSSKGLELLARDIRMAQAIVTDAGGVVDPSTRPTIHSITVTVPAVSGSTTQDVTYSFTAANTFIRTVGGVSSTLITNIVGGTGSFSAYNLSSNPAANDYETNQVKVIMTVSPNTKGNYATTTKRVISARFVLRNR